MSTIYSNDPEKRMDGAQAAYTKRTKVPGSGRKAAGVAARSISIAACISPAVAGYLATLGATRGEQVENAVRELIRLREALAIAVLACVAEEAPDSLAHWLTVDEAKWPITGDDGQTFKKYDDTIAAWHKYIETGRSNMSWFGDMHRTIRRRASQRRRAPSAGSGAAIDIDLADVDYESAE